MEHRRRRCFAGQNNGARRRGSAESPVFAQQKWPGIQKLKIDFF